jgi:hypothetical protein
MPDSNGSSFTSTSTASSTRARLNEFGNDSSGPAGRRAFAKVPRVGAKDPF